MRQNCIEDNFEDQILGIFPAGWLSAVHPLNVRVISDHGNNVMEIKDSSSKEVTEVMRRFKKTSIGIIECQVKALNTDSGFVIHLVQTDKEYDPFDDIIIFFYKRSVYVIGEENIMPLEDIDPSFLDQLVLLNDEGSVIIDEWGLESYDSVYEYDTNVWYEVKLNFSREKFSLMINGELLGDFGYPKFNPPYFAGLYFWTAISPENFKVYIDNVKITILQAMDYIHPLNIIISFLLIFFISMIVLYYLKLKKIKT